MGTDYNLLNVIIQASVGLIIFATLLIYFFQLRTMKKGTLGQNTISLINFIQDEKARNARDVVMSNLKDKNYSDWETEEKKSASRVCSTYDIVSILIYQQRLVKPDLVIDNWGPSIKKCYNILEPHIEEMQKPENAGPDYWDDFVFLYNKVIQSKKFDNVGND